MLQTLWRQVTARYATFELRNRSYAARTVERAYRGHLGRRRAQNERHKFLFSKSQSQGIEFGTVWKSNFGRPTPSSRRSYGDHITSMAWGARNLISARSELDALRLRLREEELVTFILGSPSSEVAAVRALDRPRRVGAVPQLERRVARRHLAPERLEHRRRAVPPLLHALDQQPGQQTARRRCCLLYTSPSPRD